MTPRFPMTPAGHRALQERIVTLKGPTRRAAVRALDEARSHGDLSENAEYDIAKANLGKIDRQIAELEHGMAHAEIIDPSHIAQEKVVFGATVGLRDLDSDDELSYQIVGVFESDIEARKISVESPIARALIGKEEGDEVKVKTPNGLRELEIISVAYC
jgi:transcription elongation factor GreA